ncbi:MAG TPA: Uma2 family endonuclease [Gemmatimonadales bacterium]|nr:Uma2 family endonuclease [Gemmatimonadales bacterium]
MPQTARRYTVEEVLAFPNDGNRYELVHGELLVSPAPRLGHQLVLGWLYQRLANYLAPYTGAAQILLSPADITWGTQEDLAQPDIFVVPVGETRENWDAIRTLLLAVEVLSPSTARHDRLTKRRLYQEHGVATCWIVDADARMAEVWHPADSRPEIVTDVLRWRVSPEAADLEIDLSELFTRLPG